MSKTKDKIVVIGSGPAGWTAAIYAARGNIDVTVVCGNDVGGQLTTTTDVENFPGFRNVIQGPWLMEEMRAQAENCGATIVEDMVSDADFSKRPFVITCESGKKFTADAVIISTGAQAKWLGLESESKFRGYGVSGCATCDAMFFKNKIVGVVGGGNTAVEEALHLAKTSSKVYLICRKDKLKSEKILQDRLMKTENIEILYNYETEEIIGETEPFPCVNGIKLKNNAGGEDKTIDLSGVFIAIGHSPTTAVFKNQITLDEFGYIKTEAGSTKTNIVGVFAAGDVQDRTYRQAVTAAGTGCMAALDAERLLDDEKDNNQ